MVTNLNNNKYYSMTEQSNSLVVEYGRVGSSSTSRTYPISMWNRKYREKIKKGYKDVTHLHQTQQNTSQFKPIDNSTISTLIDTLQRYAHKSIQSNYTVDASAVTQQQIREAQQALDVLSKTKKVGKFNDLLLELFTIIPRKMSKVNDFLIEERKQRQDVLKREQETLDVMRTQAKTESIQQNEPDQTILEALGIKMAESQDTNILPMMEQSSRHVLKVFEVCNHVTQPKFDNHLSNTRNSNTRLLFHGSRNQNWLNILDGGLVIRPTAANGSMFGRGLYFADKARKSIGYTSLRGSYWSGGSSSQAFLALFEVHTGEQLHIRNHSRWCYDLPRVKQFQGYDSVFAHGGADLRHNEYIVYQDCQATIKYLIELRS
jgi:poly [ADP-ribose] polymerase